MASKMPVLAVGILAWILVGSLPVLEDVKQQYALEMGVRFVVTCFVAWWFLKR